MSLEIEQLQSEIERLNRKLERIRVANTELNSKWKELLKVNHDLRVELARERRDGSFGSYLKRKFNKKKERR